MVPYTTFVKRNRLPVANKGIVALTLVRLRAIRDICCPVIVDNDIVMESDEKVFTRA